MNPAKFDHIVVGAADLDQGVAWAKSALGVDVPRGGVHVKMSTHNCVMSLGGDCYFEIIAIDPDAPPIDRGRWFGLDDPVIRRALQAEPRLLTWAINTDDIHGAFGRLADSDFSVPITIEAMTRDALSWEVGFAENGDLIENGLFPLTIQWHVDTHPSRGMRSLGCALHNIEIVTTDIARLRDYLHAMGALRLLEHVREGESDELIATLRTPVGVKRLSSAGTVEEVVL